MFRTLVSSLAGFAALAVWSTPSFASVQPGEQGTRPALLLLNPMGMAGTAVTLPHSSPKKSAIS